METKELTKEAKISKIYEAMADKSYTFGCRLHIRTSPDRHAWTERKEYMLLHEENEDLSLLGSVLDLEFMEEVDIYSNCRTYETIDKGHPVLRGDVDSYVDTNCFWIKKEGGQERDLEALQGYWSMMHYGLIGYHRKPVDERPSDMTDYVYSLIPANENH